MKSGEIYSILSFPGGSVVKNLYANAGTVGLIPQLGRSPVVGNGNPLQYSCLNNSMDSPQGRRESDTTEHTHTHSLYPKQESSSIRLTVK